MILTIFTLCTIFSTSDLSSKNNNHCIMVVHFVYTNERKTDTLLQFFLSNGINYFMLDMVNELWQRNSIQLYHSTEICFNIILNSIIRCLLQRTRFVVIFSIHIYFLFIAFSRSTNNIYKQKLGSHRKEVNYYTEVPCLCRKTIQGIQKS